MTVAKLASDFECKSDKPADVCNAVAPADEVFALADTSSPTGTTVCRRGNHRPPGGPSVSLLLHVDERRVAARHLPRQLPTVTPD